MRNVQLAICVALAAATLFPACGGSSGGGSSAPPPVVSFPTVDVIVGSRSGGIAIVKDLANHGIVGADVYIDSTGPTPINGHGNLAYENDWLVATSRNADNILVWGGVATLTNNQAPNAVLSATSDCRKPALAAGHLYVPVGNEVWIYRDISTVMTGDPADAVLTGFNRPVQCIVHDDVLYVSDRNDDTIKAYSGAATLVGGEAPTLQLAAAQNSRHMRIDGDTLWAGRDDSPGSVAGWTGLAALVDGQAPDRFLFGLFKASDRGAFWISGNRGYYGNSNEQDGFMLYRFDMDDPAEPAASVTNLEAPLDRIYALDGSVEGIVVGSDRDVNGIFYYPPLFGSGAMPSGWVFDTRMREAKDLIVIQR